MDISIKEEVINYLLDNKLLIKLEAIIGTGKSTLERSIHKWISPFMEVSVNSENIPSKYLDLFYSDVKKYAFSFQSYLISERLPYDEEIYDKLIGSNLVISERSAYGDLSFALMHYESGNISTEELEVYTDIIRKKNHGSTGIQHIHGTPVHKVIVYLDCNPEIARQRIILRNNTKEVESCTTEYLQKLDNTYLRVLENAPANEHEKEVIELINSCKINSNKDQVNKDQLIHIDYDHQAEVSSDGCLSEDQTFKILRDIITRIN